MEEAKEAQKSASVARAINSLESTVARLAEWGVRKWIGFKALAASTIDVECAQFWVVSRSSLAH